MKTPNQIARIKKAIELIESAAVTPLTNGRYGVRTERMNIQYTVTITGCDCFDFTETLKGESPCKHMWAAIGATAAMLISEIHTAKSITELESVGKKYADAMQNIYEAFKRIARDEYKKRHGELTGQATGNSNAAPQPSNTGRAQINLDNDGPLTVAPVNNAEAGGVVGPHPNTNGLNVPHPLAGMLVTPQPKSNRRFEGIEI